MQLTDNYEFLNHLMNGCDKKDVSSFSKQNNNFIEKLLMKCHISIRLRILQKNPYSHC